MYIGRDILYINILPYKYTAMVTITAEKNYFNPPLDREGRAPIFLTRISVRYFFNVKMIVFEWLCGVT